MDGGGSTTMAWWNPTSSTSELLNHPRGQGSCGFFDTERHNGNNIGIYIADVVSPVPGDVNGDRHVDCGDLALLAPFYGTDGGRSWEQGDFDGNGLVDAADITLMAAHFGRTPNSGPLGVSSARLLGTLESRVPEPSTASLVAAVLLHAPWRHRAWAHRHRRGG